MKGGRKKKIRLRLGWVAATKLALAAMAAVLRQEPDPVALWREGIAAQVGARARKEWGAAPVLSDAKSRLPSFNKYSPVSATPNQTCGPACTRR